MAQKLDSMILVTDSTTGETIGTITTKAFREWMNDLRSFVPALVETFNKGKVQCGESERVELIFVNRHGKRVL